MIRGEEEGENQRNKIARQEGQEEEKLTIINPPNTRPKLLLPQPRQRIRGLLAGIRAIPGPGATIAIDDIPHGVGRHLQDVLLPGDGPLLDLADLFPDADERVDEAVELLAGLALGRLDHEGARHGPAHRRRVEAVVLQPLGDVDHLDAGRLRERPRVQDELVRAPPVRVRVQDRVVRPQPREEVVGVEEGDFGRVGEAVAACLGSVSQLVSECRRGAARCGAAWRRGRERKGENVVIFYYMENLPIKVL